MAKKVRRVPVRFDSKGISALPFIEIKTILRGVDELIMSGGRSILAKILKGSKDKRVLEHHLEKSPVYGYFQDLSTEEITAKIDWLILNGYLNIEYDYRLPLLVYTRKGWEIEMDTYTDELLQGFDKMLESGRNDFDMTYLKDRNREMILLLIDKVERTGDAKYIPILEAWKAIDYKKIRIKLDYVINNLRNK